MSNIVCVQFNLFHYLILSFTRYRALIPMNSFYKLFNKLLYLGQYVRNVCKISSFVQMRHMFSCLNYSMFTQVHSDDCTFLAYLFNISHDYCTVLNFISMGLLQTFVLLQLVNIEMYANCISKVILPIRELVQYTQFCQVKVMEYSS